MTTCLNCFKAQKKYAALESRMARAGNFGIVPLPLRCKLHREPRKETVRLSARTIIYESGNTRQLRLRDSLTVEIVPPEPEDTRRDPLG